MTNKKELIMEKVLYFLKELAKTEEIVITDSTALNLYCIEQGKKELITYPNAVCLEVYCKAEGIDEKVNEIFTNISNEIKVIKLISESRCEYRVENFMDNWHLELYLDIRDIKEDREETRQIEGLSVYHIEDYAVVNIDKLLGNCALCYIDESVYLEDTLRAIKLCENKYLFAVNRASNRLDIDFNRPDYLEYLNECDSDSIEVTNVIRFCSPLVQEVYMYAKGEDKRFWGCVDSKIGKYDWISE